MGKITKPGMTGMYPTSVVLVTSKSAESKPNIITLAWAGIVCSDPPMVGIAIRPSRHSHGLITLSSEFVVNMPTEEILLEVDECGVLSGSDMDKFWNMGLTQLPASQVKAPLIEECPVNLECRVIQVLNLGSHDLFIGQVLATHIDEDLIDERGRIRNILEAKPIAYSPLTAEYLSIGAVIGRYGYSRDQEEDV